MFVGERTAERTGKAEQLNHAKREVGGGKVPIHIYEKTGWFKDPQGNWVNEVSDKNAKLTGALKKDGQVIPLGQAIKHDEAFRAHPNAAKTKIQAVSSLPHRGVYYPGAKTIMVRDAKDVQAILHEKQHAHQDLDGRLTKADHQKPYAKQDAEIEAFDVMHRKESGSDSKPDLLKKANGSDVTARTHLARRGR